jgi:hypothetical protein
MVYKITFNEKEAHEFFSTEYFNRTWDLIDKEETRSAEENMTMLHMAIVSLWHWTQREDATAENLSVGYWQVSHVFNLIKQPNNARTYGLLSLKYAEELEPFYKAYAYETLARAEMQTNSRVVMKFYLDKAYEMVEQIESTEDRELLLKDLETIQ